MAFDPHLNLRRATVATAPVPASSGTSLTLDDGSVFPATSLGAYNLIVWPNGVEPLLANTEIIRVTTRSGNVLNPIVRAQEGSAARSITVGDQVALVPTAKTFTDIEAAAGGGSNNELVIDGVTYAQTRAGIQAAHDALPAAGGTIRIPSGSTITFDNTTLTLSKPNTKLLGSGSTIRAPANANAYDLITAGAYPSTAGVASNLNANAAHGAQTITLVSTSGFFPGDWVIIGNNAGAVQPNRIREVVSATVLRLYRPVSAPLTMATVSNCTKQVAFVDGIEISDLKIDNNGNTNPGLITGFTASATTGITVNAFKGATGFTLSNATGFNINDYILVRDSGKSPQNGEANGWVTLIVNLVGAVVTTNGAVPFDLASATCTVQNVGAGNSGAQLYGNVGIHLQGTNKAKITNVSGINITGSLLRTIMNYEPELRSVLPRKCGFPYFGSVRATAGAIALFYDKAPFFDNCRSEDALSWAIEMFSCQQGRGECGSVSSYARGVKIATGWDHVLRVYALAGSSTGFALADGSCHNELDVFANGNLDQGCWISNQANCDNYIRFHGSGNWGGAGDYSNGATDLRNVIEVHNQDAIMVAGTTAAGYRPALFVPADNSWVLSSGAPDFALRGSSGFGYEKMPAWAFDGAAFESITKLVQMPPDWDGGAVTAVFHWAPSDTSAGNVYWQFLFAGITPNSQIDQANESVPELIVATPAVVDQETVSAMVPAFTPDMNLVRLVVARFANSASDTYNAHDAWFYGLELQYTRAGQRQAV